MDQIYKFHRKIFLLARNFRQKTSVYIAIFRWSSFLYMHHGLLLPFLILMHLFNICSNSSGIVLFQKIKSFSKFLEALSRQTNFTMLFMRKTVTFAAGELKVCVVWQNLSAKPKAPFNVNECFFVRQ